MSGNIQPSGVVLTLPGTTNRARSGQPGLATGGGGDDSGGMDHAADIAVLKQRADQADQRLERMDGKLDQIVAGLRDLATKEDVKEAKRAAWQALGVGSGIAFAVVAAFIAILTYLQDQRIATRPEPPAAPIVIQIPAPAPPAPAPAQPAPQQ